MSQLKAGNEELEVEGDEKGELELNGEVTIEVDAEKEEDVEDG